MRMTVCQDVRHDHRVRDLTELTGRWWDWQVDHWDASSVRLIADNDLTYHHRAEISFTDVAWVAVADMFSHPVFRQPTPTERVFARQIHGENADYAIFAWDAETAAATVPMMVIARSVHVVERTVIHVPHNGT
jgi:hypothetical protein